MKNYSSHIILSTASLKDGLITINQLADEILCLFVVDNSDRLVGTVTDGDIRRALISGVGLEDTIESAMNKDFVKVLIDKVSPQEIKKYRDKGIKLLPCTDSRGNISKVYNLVTKQSVLPIDAVLMAGGKGERLRPLTERTPKPLLKVGDKPIIDYNVDRLLKFGIEHIHVTVNYLAEQIETHFEKDRDGIMITCIREPEFLGTIGAVKYIQHFHHDTVLVMNSDLFTNIDLEDFYDQFSKNDADMAVAAVPYSVSVPYGIFDLDENIILGLQEKPTFNYYANGGIYMIKRRLLDLIPSDTFFNVTDLIELLIAQHYKIIRFPLLGYWIDIGKPEEFQKVQEFANHFKF
jgi:dTDP-glucose pyrophosphorylase